MKTRVFVFYAITILSLSMFLILPSAEGLSFATVFSENQISSVLIESANHMVNARY
jgi:hypothetical protein